MRETTHVQWDVTDTNLTVLNAKHGKEKNMYLADPGKLIVTHRQMCNMMTFRAPSSQNCGSSVNIYIFGLSLEKRQLSHTRVSLVRLLAFTTVMRSSSSFFPLEL